MKEQDNVLPVAEIYDLIKIFNSLTYYFTHEERQALFVFFKGVSERIGDPEVIN